MMLDSLSVLLIDYNDVRRPFSATEITMMSDGRSVLLIDYNDVRQPFRL
jgi:hypothetical protein